MQKVYIMDCDYNPCSRKDIQKEKKMAKMKLMEISIWNLRPALQRKKDQEEQEDGFEGTKSSQQ